MLKDILTQALKFEGVSEIEKFTNQFSTFYKISIYKSGLDLILTKARERKIIFEVKLEKNWDTNEGCCITKTETFYSKILKSFISNSVQKIEIRNFKINVLAHELAHAVCNLSAINLNDEFRLAIGLDIKNNMPKNTALASEFKRLMIEELKFYPQNQILPELFARYFELLSKSKEISISGPFDLQQVEDFFLNTTKWLKDIFNSNIDNKIDLDIKNFTSKMIDQEQHLARPKFADQEKSFHKKYDKSGKRSWSKNVNSNANWQESWKDYQNNS